MNTKIHDTRNSNTVPNYASLVAAYSKNPESSMNRLAYQLAKKKWTMDDVLREDKSHEDEYKETGEDKNLIDRYIIHQIGLSQPGLSDSEKRKLLIKQNILKGLWEKRHSGEDFTKALPARLGRFRQYRDIPFSN